MISFQLLWNSKINMTMDETFDKALFTTCEAELNKVGLNPSYENLFYSIVFFHISLLFCFFFFFIAFFFWGTVYSAEVIVHISLSLFYTYKKSCFVLLISLSSFYPQISECKTLPKGKGEVIPCLVEHYEEIETPTCHNYINKMATIIFRCLIKFYNMKLL